MLEVVVESMERLVLEAMEVKVEMVDLEATVVMQGTHRVGTRLN